MSSIPQRPIGPGGGGTQSNPQAPYRNGGRGQPAYHRPDSYMRPADIHGYPPSYQGYLPSLPLPPSASSNLHPQPPPPPPPRLSQPMRTQSSDPIPSSLSSGISKKRARTSQPATSPPLSAHHKSAHDAPAPPNPPSVLTREKKQKACANCRKAKLKCIVGDDQAVCVRCLARKEKCVFYPRTQGEDWQQTMAQDMFSVMANLSDLSSAVHHLLYHLSSQGIIPPFVTSRGTALDRYEAPERELPSSQGWDAEKNKELAGSSGKRRRDLKDELEEENDDGQAIGHPLAYPTNGGQSQSGRPMSGAWYISDNQGGFSESMVPDPSSSTAHHTPEISAGHQFTPPSDPNAGSLLGRTSSFTSPGLSSIQATAHPPYIPSAGSTAAIGSEKTITTYTGMMAPPGCILGSDDPREDVITQGMVAPDDAIVLVNHCHEHLSPFLFGFKLEFGHFPYLPGGPTLITPLILAVHCLLASERIPGLFRYHTPLADAVRTLIIDSPAGSWRTMGNVQDDMALGTVIPDEDYLDPEVGIGPEEIVAAALLSLWLSKQGHAREFARLAFQYARGWIKILEMPGTRSTIAETMGMVTQERVTTAQERARVWLLCYLADGIATIMDAQPPEPIRNPYDYCVQLVPHPLPNSTSRLNKHDLVLVSQARLLHLFHDWHQKFNAVLIPAQTPSIVPEIQRFTAATDVQIDDVRCSVHEIVPDHWVSAKALDLFGLFVRTTISSKLMKFPLLSRRQRATYVARTVDAGLEMLEMCSTWYPASTMADLPQQYLAMIGVVANIVTASVVEAAMQDAPTGCSVAPREVFILLDGLVRTLSTNSGLPEGHNIWVCVNSCTRLAEQLKNLCTA